MQYFTSNGIITIGKHQGKTFLDLPRQYVKWAKRNLPTFKEQLKSISKLTGKNPKALKQAQAQWKSIDGIHKCSDKGIRQPNAKRFTSRAKRPVNYSPS